MTRRPAVICRELSKEFDGHFVVQNVSFSVMPGHILALLGPSGCGKTTTLRLIAGFEELDAGSIEIDGQLVATVNRQLPPEKRRAGMVFQDYAIFPHLSVGDNVQFGLGRGQRARMQAAEWLDFVGLENAQDRMPHELSGGQQQRVALARALATEPAVLLLDEPFSNLDAALRKDVRQEVRSLLKKSGTTAVFVTHDQEEALFLGDDVAVMRAGRLEQVGSAQTIFHQPQTRFVAQFIGQTDFIRGTIAAGGRIVTALGTVHQQNTLPIDTVVEAAVRPDDVRMRSADDGLSRIVDRQFLGIANLYRLKLPDGEIVHSWQPHQIDIQVGAPVHADLRPDHTLAFFHQDIAI